MKKIFAIAGLVAALTASAFAQADSHYINDAAGNPVNGTTNAVQLNATNTYAEFTVPRSANIAVYVSFKLGSALTGNIDFRLVPTDGAGNASTSTADYIDTRIAATGTTTTTRMFKVAAGGYPGFKLIIENTNAVTASHMTNLVVKVITKNGL